MGRNDKARLFGAKKTKLDFVMMNIEVFKNKFFDAAKALMQLMMVWVIILLIMRLFELVFNGITRSFPDATFKFIALSIGLDLLFWLKVWGYVFIVFIGLYFIRPKLAKIVGIAVLYLLSILQLLLISYFNTSLVPLGADLFGYSIADIKQTVGASSGVSTFAMISVVFLLLLFGSMLIFMPKRIKVTLAIALVIPFISLIAYVTNAYKYTSLVALENEYDNNLSINKTDYFLSTSINYFLPSNTETDIYADSYIQQFEGEERTTTAFVYPYESEYPFYHTNEAPDVLSPFFKPIKSPPNIVILLVEGLGRAFTNDGAYLGNFTPFLDSLSAKSLYWKNFLSIGGRTFGVLPSLMGSMPFAENGILEMGDRMPAHLSLYNLLKYNGYHSSFYYGGDADFDNMGVFLRRNGVDEIGDLKTIPSSYTKLPAKENGFSWGYTDDQVYAYYLNGKNTNVPKKPELSVILTVATHDPFLIQNQGKYLKVFEQRMGFLGFGEAKKAQYRNFEKQYSSIMYADEAIKNFLIGYQKRADYENTIFIITGDHRMAEIPLRSKIDRFHVPLIIFSPLLKRTAQFESISTHFDVTPSLLSLLKKNLSLNLPTGSSWMGDGLDTARSFRNIHSYPLIQTKTAMVDFVSGEYHLNGNQLFKLNSDLNETPIQDEGRLNQLMSSFNNFKTKNNKIAKGGKLLPDSIIKAYKLR